jgi:ubiquinone/menaquinone biosynthesis C-methylase UbiE
VDVKDYWDELASSGAWSTTSLYGSHVDATNYNCLTRRECVRELLAAEGTCERILDIGCGTGDYFTIAAGHQASYHGIDWSRGMAQGAIGTVAGLGSKHLIVVGSGVAIPYASNCFDIVLAIGYIEYFANPREAIQEIRRVLKPDGILVMQSYKRDVFQTLDELGRRLGNRYRSLLGAKRTRSDKSWPWEKQYSRRGLDRLLAPFGFERTDYRFNNHWIYWRSLQVRWPGLYIRASEVLNRLNSAWCSCLAVNYVGKYKLRKTPTGDGAA